MESKVSSKRTNKSHRAVHFGRHLFVGGTVSELFVSFYKGENGFAFNKEQLPPVTWPGLDYKLVPIGTADTIREDLVQVDPFAV